MQTMIDDAKLKALLKEVIIEVLEERSETITNFFAEILEDLALAKAIREGENSEKVGRKEIFKILEGQQ
ncbi:MAG: hypothetical protein HUU32_02740 [Calditrichaceae bacterium]|nr:hypothetical protein [Calditrichia bacterium]NUQ40295.1 hypothetical protein [Calditrichaceae bacterium]